MSKETIIDAETCLKAKKRPTIYKTIYSPVSSKLNPN